MWMLLLSCALAGEPTSWVTQDGTVVGTVSLPAPPAAVASLVADPIAVNALNGGNTRVTLVSRDGACAVLDYVSPSAIVSDVKYRVRHCPRADGAESTLVQSESFSHYRTRWTLTPEGTGTLARYELDMKVTMWVPKSLVDQTTKREIRKMLTRILAHYSAPR